MKMSLSVWQVLFTAVFVYIVTKLIMKAIQFKRFRDNINKIPGQPSFSLIFGTLHKYPKLDQEGLEYILTFVRTVAPKVMREWLGPFFPLIVAHHPDTVKVILKSSEPKPRGKYIRAPYDIGLPWLGEGLLLTNGERWARNRHLLTPSFHFDILKNYLSAFNRSADVLMSKVQADSEQGNSFETFNYLSLCALDILMTCSLSYKTDCQTRESFPYVQAVCRLGDLWCQRALKPYLLIDFVYNRTSEGKEFKRLCKYVHSVAEDIIQKRMEAMEHIENKGDKCGGKKNLDFLDILLKAKDENGVGLTMEEIRNEVDTFLFAGHDTTTVAMSWTLYYLSMYPDYQRRVQEEIDSLFQGRDSDDFTSEDFTKMPFFTICLKEALRLRPPVAIVARKLSKELELEGVVLPEGTFVVANMYNMGHNPHVWENPEEYYPERFLRDRNDMDPFAFVPFSAGPRNCIGQNFAMQEMKVVLGKLLHRFNFSLVEGQDIKVLLAVVLRAEHGIHLKATSRHHRS